VVAMGRHPFTDFWGHITASDKAIVLNALRMINIENKISCFFDHLSDGEKQKVMIAKALAQQTPFIFLDEPAAFLDFPSRIEIMQLLSELAHHQNKTILLSTHDVPLAFQYADEIILMALSKPTISAKPSEIILENLLPIILNIHSNILFLLLKMKNHILLLKFYSNKEDSLLYQNPRKVNAFLKLIKMAKLNFITNNKF
jgi:ABC-type cobalamin/Fe3+-siderophores transport system ATPase subunit